MGRSIELTRPYLIVVTIFVVLRFVLELAGLSNGVTSEISLTRLVFVLPIFLGLRFAREGLGGFKEMMMANFVYSFWGVFLIMIITTVDVMLGLNTHYSFGPDGSLMPLPAHLLGHVVQIIVFTVVLSIICWVTAKLAVRQPASATT